MPPAATSSHAPLATPGVMPGIARLFLLPRLALAAYAPLWALMLAYFAISRIALWSLPTYAANDPRKALPPADLVFVLLYGVFAAFFVWRLWVYARHGMPRHPARQFLSDTGRILLDPARLSNFAALFPLMLLFIFTFTEVKGNITRFVPFSWDETFMRLDRLLHGGADPWQLLQPIFGTPAATFAINVLYGSWFALLLYVYLVFVLRRAPSRDSLRFAFAFLLTWSVGGSLLAILFSSAGPVYYGRLGLSPDPYAPLMEMLRDFDATWPGLALQVQEKLWEMHVGDEVQLGGISAFPSMHNAHATLMALHAWRHSRLLGAALGVFAFFIMLGSVWLGWHYAVDAYAGIAIAVIMWHLADPLARRAMARPAMRRYLAALRRLAPLRTS